MLMPVWNMIKDRNEVPMKNLDIEILVNINIKQELILKDLV